MNIKHTILFYESEVDTQQLEDNLKLMGYTLLKCRLFVEISRKYKSDDVYCAMAVIDKDDDKAIEFLRSVMQSNWMVQRVGLVRNSQNNDLFRLINRAHVDYLWPLSVKGKELQKLLRKVGRRHAKLTRPFVKFDMLSEVTEDLLNQNEKFREQATRDALTRLYNRRSFNSMGRRFWERYKNSNIVFTLAIVDLDHFKWVNDAYGHLAGDEVLRQIASVLISNQRAGIDFAFRYGGEEFAIISIGASLDEKYLYLNRLIKLVRQLKVELKDGRQITTTFSGGICASADAKNFDDMLSKADAALYLAKESGRDQIMAHGKLQTQLSEQPVKNLN